MLARLLHLYPDMAPAPEVRELFGRQITSENVAGECDYLRGPAARGFERPYGWAWLLKLAEGLMQLPDLRWSAMVAPLVEIFVGRFKEFLAKATYPVRVGTHFNRVRSRARSRLRIGCAGRGACCAASRQGRDLVWLGRRLPRLGAVG
jgi:hypothetical protein